MKKYPQLYCLVFLFATLSVHVSHAQNPITVDHRLADTVLVKGTSHTVTLKTPVFKSTAGNDFTYESYQVVANAQVALPAWLTFGNSPLKYTATPQTADVGNYVIVLKATQATFSQTDTFKLQVIAEYPKPVLKYKAEDQDVFDNAPKVWTLKDSTFYDTYKLPLTYTAKLLKNNALENLPTWLTFTTTTRKFEAKPARPDVGFHKVVLEASNGHLTNKDTFEIEVIKVNVAPKVAAKIPGQLFEEGFRSRTLNIATNFSDFDGDPLTYTVTSSNPSVASVSLTGSVITFTEGVVGSTDITVTAKDPEGLQASDKFTVIIRKYQEVFNFTTGNTGSNGLVESWVRSIHIENDNELWIGTDFGLSVFDPSNNTWKNSFENGNRGGEGDNEIRDVLETSTNKKCLVVMRGIQLQTATGFEYLTRNNFPGLGDFVLTGKIDKEDKLWLVGGVVQSQKLSILKINLATKTIELNKEFGPYTPVASLALDENNKPWIGTSKGLYHFDGTDVKTYSTQNGLTNSEVSLVACKNGKVYAYVMGSINILDRQTNTFTSLNNANLLYQNEGGFLFVENDGTILTVGIHNGFIKYSPTTGWQNRKLNFLGNNFVFGYPILDGKRDSKNNLWVGTRWGLLKYEGDPITTDPIVYNTFDGLPANDVYKILKDDDGNMWFPTDMNGVSKYDGANWDWITKTLPMESAVFMQNTTAAFVSRGGDLWLGGAGGANLSKDGGKTWKTFISADYTYGTNVLNMNNVMAFGEDAAGNIWVGGVGYTTNMGLNKFNGTNWSVLKKTNGLKAESFRQLFGDSKGNMWLAYSGTTESVMTRIAADGSMVHFAGDQQNGIDFRSITQILETDNGNIWISTGGGSAKGIGVYNGTTWTYFGATNGLKSPQVVQMAQDGLGNIWIAYNPTSNLGVSMYNGTTWQHFNKDNGLPSNQINALQTLVTSSGTIGGRTKSAGGTLWLGTLSEGVSKIDIDGFLNLLCKVDKPAVASTKNPDGTFLLTITTTAPNVQWYLNGTAITGATAKTYTATEDGTYTVKGINGTCVSPVSDDLKIIIPPKIITALENSGKHGVTLYPNPASAFLEVVINDADVDSGTMTIIDVSGRTHITDIVPGEKTFTVLLEGLTPGIYLLQWKGEQGVGNKRFVKR